MLMIKTSVPLDRKTDRQSEWLRAYGLSVHYATPARVGLIGKRSVAYPLVVADDLFKALADPTRRTILDELAEKSGQTLFEICSRLSVKHGLGSSRQAISQHLAVLEAAGLVETRREGRYKFHDLNTAPLRQIAERWPPPDPLSDPPRPEESTP